MTLTRDEQIEKRYDMHSIFKYCNTKRSLVTPKVDLDVLVC